MFSTARSASALSPSPPIWRARARTRSPSSGSAEDRAALRRGREAAPPARPLRLRAAANPVHRRRHRPGARRPDADRARARPAETAQRKFQRAEAAAAEAGESPADEPAADLADAA